MDPDIDRGACQCGDRGAEGFGIYVNLCEREELQPWRK